MLSPTGEYGLSLGELSVSDLDETAHRDERHSSSRAPLAGIGRWNPRSSWHSATRCLDLL